MKKTILLKSLLLLCALIVGSSYGWADGTINITYSNVSATSYSADETTFTESGISFGYKNVARNNANGTPSGWAKNQVIQVKASSGVIYNTTAISGLKNIRVYVVVNTNPFTVTSGTSKEPTTNPVSRPTTATGSESITYTAYADKKEIPGQTTSATYYDFPVSDDYFKITNGSNALYIWKIVLTYETYTITPISNDEDMGTVSVTGNIITATPNSGYRVANGNDGYTVISGDATVTHTGHSNTLSVSASSDCTIRVNFEETPTHTATFSVNGVTTSEVFLEDASVTFPSDPEDLGGKVFVGWYTSEYSHASVAPSYVNTATEKMGETNITYYAVFATQVETTNWQKMEVSNVTEAGVYALVSDGNYAFSGTISSGHGQKTSSTFSFTNNIATSAPDGTCEITLEAVSGGYKMYNSTYGYLYATKAGSGGLAWKNDDDQYWYNSSGSWMYSKNYSGSYARLRCYDNTFRTYNSNTNNPMYLAKKITVATYSNYCTSITTSITTNAGKWTSFTPSWNATLSAGATAYIITDVSENIITATSVDVLKKNNGYFVKGDAASTAYSVKATYSDPSSTSGNLIKGCTSSTGIDATTPIVSNKYVLGTTSGGESGLFLVDSYVTVGAGKAYLDAGGSGGAHVLSLNFDENGEVTGICNVNNEVKSLFDGDFYNLAGQKVSQPAKGLYIINGRKVVLK